MAESISDVVSIGFLPFWKPGLGHRCGGGWNAMQVNLTGSEY